MTSLTLPFLTRYDPPGASEGTLDPLGLYMIADQLATQLVPAVRERMMRIRFLTAATIGAWITEDLMPNENHPQIEPFLVWEWLVVEAIVRTMDSDEELWGVPGSLVVRHAIANHGYVDERSYLKTARVFGFHGVYKRLGLHLALVDTHLRCRAPRGEELVQAWARDQGVARFQTGTPLFDKWHRAIEASLKETPIRTRMSSRWTLEDWRELAEAFLPQGARIHEKRCLNRMLHAAGENQLGALVPMWNLRKRLDGQKIDEREFHRQLCSEAPEYSVLLESIAAYEMFCRNLTDAFNIVRSFGSKHDLKGLQISSLGSDEVFCQIAGQTHEVYLKALERLNAADPTAESRFIDRFTRFAEPLAPVEFARMICEHHEKVQESKSRDGKRAWFDRIGADRIYVRQDYRIEPTEPAPDAYVHDYRMNPIHRFLQDLR